MENVIKELTDANLNNGFACAANERMADSTFSEALTNFVAGVHDAETEKLLNFIAPPVRSARRFEFRKDKGAILWSDESDSRSVGADFRRISVESERVDSSTVNRGLVIRIDNDERYDGIEEQKVQSLILRLIRNECRRAVAGLLAAAGTATEKSWLTGNTKTDPDSDIIDLIESVGDDVGVDPNRLLFGRKAWNARFRAYRASQNAYAGVAARDGVSQLADMYGVDEIYRAGERYADKSGKKTIMKNDYIVAFLGCDNPVEGLDTSVLKRFWTPCEGGEAFRVYREEKAKYVDITVEHYSRILSTVSGCAKAISIV